jgi:hypothetical protein
MGKSFFVFLSLYFIPRYIRFMFQISFRFAFQLEMESILMVVRAYGVCLEFVFLWQLKRELTAVAKDHRLCSDYKAISQRI